MGGADFPLVLPDDDGIRPAGPPDGCFYCRSKVGTPHGRGCVAVEKTVRVRYVFELDIPVPHHWAGSDLEAHRNGGAWCADNALTHLEAAREAAGCLCGVFRCEYVGDVDAAPRAKSRPARPGEMAGVVPHPPPALAPERPGREPGVGG